ncbi:MAG: hypothetical protein QY311_02120 [Candidatus Paceibacterota bacterium]|nr:MAG: hypothetical protein QY311_02120 [Candidatus Paceibacterota bacterium]
MSILNYYFAAPYLAKRLKEDPKTRGAFIAVFGTLPQNIKAILVAQETAEKLVAFGDQYNLKYDVVEDIAFALREVATRTIALEKVPSFLVARGLQNDIAIAAAKEIENILGTPTGSAEQVTNNVVDLRNKSGV